MKRVMVSRQTPLRVVLIDDEDSIAELLRINFELDERFEFVARGMDGAEALELVRRHQPDAVLMDIHMPRLGGIEATRILLKANPYTCVIAFTSSRDPAELQAVRAAGAVAVLNKPFDPLAFLDAVEEHAAGCAADAA